LNVLNITRRILTILLIFAATGFVILQIVNREIERASPNSFEGWPALFTWLRHLSSMGLIGAIAHTLPFFLATVIVVVVERLWNGSKK
jgi:hypothetical protein